MKNRFPIPSTLAIVLIACPFAFAAGPSVTIEASSSSQYVWRGLAVTNDPVFQTSSTLLYGGAHLNIFTNQELTSANGRRGKINELDYDAGYDFSREKYTLSAGAIRYTFPNTAGLATTELYAGASFGGWLHPSVRGFFDVSAYRGNYTTFDVYHGLTLPRLSQSTTLDAVFSAGLAASSARHNAAYYGVERTALADFHPSLAFPVTHGRWRITPRAGYSLMLDHSLRQGPGATLHGFYATAALSFTFSK